MSTMSNPGPRGHAFDSLSSRRSGAVAGGGVGIALAVAGLLWIVFSNGVGVRQFGGLSRTEAIEEAASAGGPRWPGTSVSVKDQRDRVVVERHWLGLRESRSSIVELDDGWYDGGSPELGPGELAQGMVVVVIAPAMIGWGFARLFGKRRLFGLVRAMK